MSYYKNFKIVIGTPIWRKFISWRYSKCIEDFQKLNFTPKFENKDFSALLCGVGNEATADEFLKFVYTRNKLAKVWIIDLGEEQIAAVAKLVKEKYTHKKIQMIQYNALKLDEIIKVDSIDWIETDGLFEFLKNDEIVNLLKVWRKILKSHGFATTTATSARWWLQDCIDRFKVWIGRKWLGVRVYQHSRIEMRSNFKKAGFNFVEGTTYIPYFKRYSMIKG